MSPEWPNQTRSEERLLWRLELDSSHDPTHVRPRLPEPHMELDRLLEASASRIAAAYWGSRCETPRGRENREERRGGTDGGEHRRLRHLRRGSSSSRTRYRLA